MDKITFELDGDQRVKILKDGVEAGHIFSPGSSGSNEVNVVQVCGFTEAFDLWGCGIYKGTKDICLLYDDKKFEGVHVSEKNQWFNWDVHKDCICCYNRPCKCDNKLENNTQVPFRVKRSHELQDRIEKKKTE